MAAGTAKVVALASLQLPLLPQLLLLLLLSRFHVVAAKREGEIELFLFHGGQVALFSVLPVLVGGALEDQLVEAGEVFRPDNLTKLREEGRLHICNRRAVYRRYY